MQVYISVIKLNIYSYVTQLVIVIHNCNLLTLSKVGIVVWVGNNEEQCIDIILMSYQKSLYLHVTLFQQCSPVSLFDSDDCVLTDVNLSDASEDNLLDFKKKFSYSSLHSDGDSYPNSPINGKFHRTFVNSF